MPESVRLFITGSQSRLGRATALVTSVTIAGSGMEFIDRKKQINKVRHTGLFKIAHRRDLGRKGIVNQDGGSSTRNSATVLALWPCYAIVTPIATPD
jgi:hypothetical protein